MEPVEGNIEGTGKFVQDTRRDAYWAAQEKELLELIDPETGVLFEALQVDRGGCPICETAENSHIVFVKRAFFFWKCNACQCVYVNPVVNQEELRKSYEHNQSQDLWMEVLLSEPQKKSDLEKYKVILNNIHTLLPRNLAEQQLLLDVGSSIGTFLSMATAQRYQAFGVELNDRTLTFSRNLVGKAIEETFQESPEMDKVIFKGTLNEYVTQFEKDPFDVVTYLEVMEHITDPLTELQNVYRALRPSGLLVLIVPNLYSASARTLQRECAMFEGRNHVNYFSDFALDILLRKSKFIPIQFSTMLTDGNTLWNWLHYLPPYQGDLIAPQYVHDFIKTNELGYKLVCFARRV